MGQGGKNQETKASGREATAVEVGACEIGREPFTAQHEEGRSQSKTADNRVGGPGHKQREICHFD